MARVRGRTAGASPPHGWRSQLTAGAVIAAAFVSALPTAAFAEGATCVGESCSGTYAAVTTTGEAQSSQGVAVSGTGSASGGVAEVGAGQGIAGVEDPTTGYKIGFDNTGVAITITAPESVASLAYSPPADVIAAKQATLQQWLPEVRYQVAAAAAGLDPHLADSACPNGTCFVWTKTLSQWLTYQIKKYYCGPASTQLILTQLGILTNQTYLADRLYTEKQGATALHDIVRVLNQVQTENGMHKAVFTALRLAKDDPTAYLAIMMISALGAADPVPHSIVNNIDSGPLGYWNDKQHPAQHFNVSHGFSLGVNRTESRIDVAEEYDPTKVGVRRKTNPYGYHSVPLTEIYNAVLANKANQGVVIW